MRRGAGSRQTLLPPGSAAASAAQVEALLARLEELETHVGVATTSEEELKAVNLALMERLAAFQRANEENVEATERGLKPSPAPLTLAHSTLPSPSPAQSPSAPSPA